MNRRLAKLSTMALLLAASGIAYARPVDVPEPGILELLALAAVVGLIARKRRK